MPPEQKVLASSFALASFGQMLSVLPILQFMGIGAVGGMSGYLLLMEQGKLDDHDFRRHLCVLARRVLLGVAIGTVVYVGWADSSDARGLWLLTTGVVATSPVEMIRRVVELVQSVLTKRAGV